MREHPASPTATDRGAADQHENKVLIPAFSPLR
jgi:hypothetical protein